MWAVITGEESWVKVMINLVQNKEGAYSENNTYRQRQRYKRLQQLVIDQLTRKY